MNSNEIYKQLLQLLNENPDKLDLFFKNMMDNNFDNEDYWKHILETMALSDDFIKKNIDHINVYYLLKYQLLSDDILFWLKDNIILTPADFKILIKNQKLNIDMINYYIDKMYPVDWETLVFFQDLTSDLLIKYHDKFNWDDVTVEQFLTLEVIEKFKDKIDWVNLPLNMKSQYLFNDAFVYHFKDFIKFNNIGVMEKVTVDCIMNFKDKLDEDGWSSVLMFKELPVEMLEEVIELANKYVSSEDLWGFISTNQNLTIPFMDKHSESLVWKHVCINQKLDWEFIAKWHKNISLYYLSRNEHLTSELIKKIEENKDLFQDELDKELLKSFIV